MRDADAAGAAAHARQRCLRAAAPPPRRYAQRHFLFFRRLSIFDVTISAIDFDAATAPMPHAAQTPSLPLRQHTRH